MNTREILHHYYGAHCEYEWLAGLHSENGTTRARISLYLLGLNGILIRPILRPLHTISAEEYHEYLKLEELEAVPNQEIRSRAFSPLTLVFLLNRGFDLFDLIHTGQAIDATKLEANPYLPWQNQQSNP